MNLIRALTYCFMISFSLPGLTEQLLTPIQYFNTTGARELTPFKLNGEYFIAAAQLATDIPGTPSTMDGGNADVDVIVYKKQDDKFREYQRIPSHGNESVTFFNMEEHSYLAVASIHSGPKPPFNFLSYSMLYRWDGRYFYPVQQFLTYGAKQSYYFNIGKRHFLAFANGVVNPTDKSFKKDSNSLKDTNSKIYEWDGTQFVPFQTIASLWGVSFKSFMIGKDTYLAFADHINGATLYRWDGKKFSELQQFKGLGARAFEFFTIKGKHYLAYANIKTDSYIFQWNGKKFIQYQDLKGLGGRNFAYFSLNDQHYLMRVNYIIGNRDKPKIDLQSPLYQWKDGQFITIQNIATYAGVSAHVFNMDDFLYMTLANCLNDDSSFKVKSVLYEITHGKTVEFG